MLTRKRRRFLLIGFAAIIFVALLATLFLILIFKPMAVFKTKKIIRPAAVSGQFYPADQELLSRTINDYLADAPAAALDSAATGTVKIILAPHAGYDYSAPVMAAAYKILIGQKIKRVYLIGNSHRSYFSGISLDDSAAWKTPLGQVAVDTKKVAELTAVSPLIKADRAAHLNDHILEVQLPFLQTVLGSDFKIVPLLFGSNDNDDYAVLAAVLADNLEDGDLLVISSDMSHYPLYETANKIDRQTLELIKNKDLAGLERQAQEAVRNETGEETILCSLEAVKTGLVLARQLNLTPQILVYKNSGDTLFGDKKAVVGYGAVIFTEDGTAVFGQMAAASREETRDLGKNLSKEENLTKEEQEILLNIARESVENYVKNHKIPDFKVKEERLTNSQGAFVTIKKQGELRGCIGKITAKDSLWQVVRDMAIAAATEDDRFIPILENELKNLTYEISVLSVPTPLSDWRQIKLGRDGVIIKKGLNGGVFLPQVAAETGWNLEEFLSQLCRQKAGLAPDCYKDDPAVELSVFQAQVF